MKPTELSRELRHGTGGYLDERRGIVVASLTGDRLHGAALAIPEAGAAAERISKELL